MSWTTIIETGDNVTTPQGNGRVVRISQAQASAQVAIDGQLYEIPLTDITNVPDTIPPQPASTPAAKPVKPWTAKPQRRVQTKDATQHGEITEVTQRTVRVKFDDGDRVAIPKRDVAKHLDFEPKGSTPPSTQPQEHELPEQSPQPTQEATHPTATTDTVQATGDGLYELLKLKEHLEQRIDTSIDGELAELRDQVKKSQQLEVHVGDQVHTVGGLRHKQLDQLITYAAMRLSPLLIGMAGTGKTHAGSQVAEAMGLAFYSMSVGAQTSKSDIIGYMAANGQYVSTHFRQAYEFGGVFLMDEIDAGNANVLIQINAALSNGLCAFPDAMVKRHEDFIFIASANTFGNGANRQYVGRNQLDAATLDRFALIEWLIDDDLEESLAVGLNGKAWYMAVRAARDYVAEKNIRALISPRATQKGSQLLHAGQDLAEVIRATLLGSVPEDKKPDVTKVAQTIFEKFASEVPSQLSKSVNPEISDLVRGAVEPDLMEVQF